MNTPNSKHIFLFPFTWNKSLKNGKFSPFITAKALDNFENALIAYNWKSTNYTSFETLSDFNEYQYFYPYVRDAMYDFGDKNKNIIRHFSFPINDPGKSSYRIEILAENIKDPGRKKNAEDGKIVYELQLNELLLNIYQTGVGILSFHLEYYSPENNPVDVLAINQYGRRIFPPFLPINDCKNSELADNISIKIDDRLLANENFKDFENAKYIQNLDSANQLPGIITKLIPAKEFNVKPAIDDRMFVISWFGANQDVLDSLSKKENNQYGYQNDDFWLKYIFMDVNNPTLQNSIEKLDIIKEHTYARWIDFKYENTSSPSLYGASRYSFVAVSSLFNFLPAMHTTTMYYKMVELCLVQRISVINFSGMVSQVSNKLMEINNGKLQNEILQDIKYLYNGYIQFVNKIYFREVTHQDQGIEIYNQLQKLLSIDNQVKDLDTEISELHNFTTMLEEETQSRNSLKLSSIATWFLPASVVVSLMGINAFDKTNMVWGGAIDRSAWYWIGLAIALSLLIGEALFGFKHFRNFYRYIKKKSKK